MLKIKSNSENETICLGKEFAGVLAEEDLVVL